MGIKFYVGDENKWDEEKVEWTKATFPKNAYNLIDAGWSYAEYYIEFIEEKDALLFRLRWQ